MSQQLAQVQYDMITHISRTHTKRPHLKGHGGYWISNWEMSSLGLKLLTYILYSSVCVCSDLVSDGYVLYDVTEEDDQYVRRPSLSWKTSRRTIDCLLRLL